MNQTKLFTDLPLHEALQKAIADMGFAEATPIQAEAIPIILNNQDIIGQAQTGTGKTCAFGIPLVQNTAIDKFFTTSLILAPTRELALQITKEIRMLTKYKEGVRVLALYGGQPIQRQIMALKRRPQIIVGTPGRIMDHMKRRTLRLDRLESLILDEADEMLNMGFRTDIDFILTAVPEKIQKIFFSATLSKEMKEIVDCYLKDPAHIKIAAQPKAELLIDQSYMEVKSHQKLTLLTQLLEVNSITRALVFCNTKKRADLLSQSLIEKGYLSDALHGDMRQSARDQVMRRFRQGQLNVLVATDVAARGIDVEQIQAVFNYDLPNDEEYYIHRIGRTGRAGKTGKAYTFVVGREILSLKQIQNSAKFDIKSVVFDNAGGLIEVESTSFLDKPGKSSDSKTGNRFPRSQRSQRSPRSPRSSSRSGAFDSGNQANASRSYRGNGDKSNSERRSSDNFSQARTDFRSAGAGEGRSSLKKEGPSERRSDFRKDHPSGRKSAVRKERHSEGSSNFRKEQAMDGKYSDKKQQSVAAN